MKLTSQEVTNRLRPLFQKAVMEHTGVSYLLSAQEASIFTVEDLDRLKEETGYQAPAPVILARSSISFFTRNSV